MATSDTLKVATYIFLAILIDHKFMQGCNKKFIKKIIHRSDSTDAA